MASIRAREWTNRILGEGLEPTMGLQYNTLYVYLGYTTTKKKKLEDHWYTTCNYGKGRILTFLLVDIRM